MRKGSCKNEKSFSNSRTPSEALRWIRWFCYLNVDFFFYFPFNQKMPNKVSRVLKKLKKCIMDF